MSWGAFKLYNKIVPSVLKMKENNTRWVRKSISLAYLAKTDIFCSEIEKIKKDQHNERSKHRDSKKWNHETSEIEKSKVVFRFLDTIVVESIDDVWKPPNPEKSKILSMKMAGDYGQWS